MQDEMGESRDSEKDDDDKEEHTNSSQLPFQRKHLHPNEKPQTTFLSKKKPKRSRETYNCWVRIPIYICVSTPFIYTTTCMAENITVRFDTHSMLTAVWDHVELADERLTELIRPSIFECVDSGRQLLENARRLWQKSYLSPPGEIVVCDVLAFELLPEMTIIVWPS